MAALLAHPRGSSLDETGFSDSRPTSLTRPSSLSRKGSALIVRSLFLIEALADLLVHDKLRCHSHRAARLISRILALQPILQSLPLTAPLQFGDSPEAVFLSMRSISADYVQPARTSWDRPLSRLIALLRDVREYTHSLCDELFAFCKRDTSHASFRLYNAETMELLEIFGADCALNADLWTEEDSEDRTADLLGVKEILEKHQDLLSPDELQSRLWNADVELRRVSDCVFLESGDPLLRDDDRLDFLQQELETQMSALCREPAYSTQTLCELDCRGLNCNLSDPAGRLGEGSFAFAWRAEYRGAPIAVKVFKQADKLDAHLEMAKREVFFKQMLSLCRGVIGFHGISMAPHSPVFFAMELAAHSLHDALYRHCAQDETSNLVYRLGEGENDTVLKLRLMLQVCEAVDFIHSVGVLHRDLNPRNVLISFDGQAKLADFGLAIIRRKKSSHRGLHGTAAYIAPEILLSEDTSSVRYSEESDMFSFGVTLNEVLSHYSPFAELSTEEIRLRHKLKEGLPEVFGESHSLGQCLPECRDGVVHELHHLLLRCLDSRSEQRPTAAMAAHTLRRTFSTLAESDKSVALSVEAFSDAETLYRSSLLRHRPSDNISSQKQLLAMCKSGRGSLWVSGYLLALCVEGFGDAFGSAVYSEVRSLFLSLAQRALLIANLTRIQRARLLWMRACALSLSADCTRRESPQCVSTLLAAAEGGCVMASYSLARCYLEGRGVSYNEELGVHYLQRAAEIQFPPAVLLWNSRTKKTRSTEFSDSEDYWDYDRDVDSRSVSEQDVACSEHKGTSSASGTSGSVSASLSLSTCTRTSSFEETLRQERHIALQAQSASQG